MKKIGFRCVVCEEHKFEKPAFEDHEGPVCFECEGVHEETMSEFADEDGNYAFDLWGDE